MKITLLISDVGMDTNLMYHTQYFLFLFSEIFRIENENHYTGSR